MAWLRRPGLFEVWHVEEPLARQRSGRLMMACGTNFATDEALDRQVALPPERLRCPVCQAAYRPTTG